MNPQPQALSADTPVGINALCAMPDILARGRFSKSHLYNLMTRGLFPKPCIRVGPRFTRWNAAEIDKWFADPVVWMDVKRQQKCQPDNSGVAA